MVVIFISRNAGRIRFVGYEYSSIHVSGYYNRYYEQSKCRKRCQLFLMKITNKNKQSYQLIFTNCLGRKERAIELLGGAEFYLLVIQTSYVELLIVQTAPPLPLKF